MQHDFRVGCRLKDRARSNELLAQRDAVGEVAVVGNGDAADFQFREQRLHVSQDRLAGGGVAHMADGAVARQTVQRRRIGEMVTDEAHMAFGMETAIMVGNNAGGLLPAMLKGMQAQCCQCGGVFMAKYAKYAALFMQGVFIQHKGGIFRRMAGHCRKAFRLQRQLKRLSITRWLFVKSEEFTAASI